MSRLLKLCRQNLLIRIAIYTTVVMIAVFAYGVIKLNTYTDEIRQKRAILDDRQNIQLNFEEVLSLYSNQYETLSTNLDKLRPKVDDVVFLLDDIESGASQIGLNIAIKNLGIQSLNDLPNAVRYETVFTGNQDQLDRFLSLLFDLPSFVEIQSVNIEEIQEFSIEELAEFSLVFDIFVK